MLTIPAGKEQWPSVWKCCVWPIWSLWPPYADFSYSFYYITWLLRWFLQRHSLKHRAAVFHALGVRNDYLKTSPSAIRIRNCVVITEIQIVISYYWKKTSHYWNISLSNLRLPNTVPQDSRTYHLSEWQCIGTIRACNSEPSYSKCFVTTCTSRLQRL